MAASTIPTWVLAGCSRVNYCEAQRLFSCLRRANACGDLITHCIFSTGSARDTQPEFRFIVDYTVPLLPR
jgi:hypothetical protein